jgi:quinol monooxygenase YgiN
MSNVHLAGQLICKTAAEAQAVIAHLPDHIERTRSEPGCVSFSVMPTDDPFVWSVEEEFKSQPALESHQARVARSEWGRATAGIERRYAVR